jgi:hypothetical protein
MAGERVRVVFRKYDGSLHWHLTLPRLGEDEHGVWVGQPAGGSMRKGSGPPVPLVYAHVGLVSPQVGWVAWFNGPPDRLEVYCDVTTVPVWTSASEVTMIDLDLDVCRLREDKSVRVLDEDEFAEHRLRYGYPDAVVAEATRTAEWLRTALADGTQPFADAYQPWLARVL